MDKRIRKINNFCSLYRNKVCYSDMSSLCPATSQIGYKLFKRALENPINEQKIKRLNILSRIKFVQGASSDYILNLLSYIEIDDTYKLNKSDLQTINLLYNILKTI